MTENQLQALYMDFQQEWLENHSEDFISDEEREKIEIDDFLGADEEDFNTLIKNYKERKKFDDGVRSLAQNDDEYSFLKSLDNY